MDLMSAVQTCFRKYVTFSGRAVRSEFWWFTLFCILGSIAAALLDSIFGIFRWGDMGPLEMLFSLATFLPSLAVSVRRLHDRDRSGWWMLLAFIPLIGWIVLLIWFIQKGDEGPNRFGDDYFAIPEEFGSSNIPPVRR